MFKECTEKRWDEMLGLAVQDVGVMAANIQVQLTAKGHMRK